MAYGPIVRRPFRVEPSRDQRTYIVTDVGGRVVGKLEFDARERTWRALAAHPSHNEAAALSGEMVVTHVGTYGGVYGQADALTAMESWFSRRFSGVNREDDSS